MYELSSKWRSCSCFHNRATTKTKSLFPLMPLPFEPLIHFNPNVFRQKRECKLYLCQCATVPLRLYNFISYSFGCSSIRCLCHYYVYIFFSLLLAHFASTIVYYLFIFIQQTVVHYCCLFIFMWHIKKIHSYISRAEEKNEKMYGGVQFLAIDSNKNLPQFHRNHSKWNRICDSLRFSTCSFRLSHEIQWFTLRSTQQI